MIAEENRSTTVLQVNSVSPDHAIISDAGKLIQDGGLVAFPTETVYGLGANALDANAVLSIYRAKGRPSRNPLIVHFVGNEMLQKIVEGWSEIAAVLAKNFWPGPLTLVLPKSDCVPDEVTGGGNTVAVREPSNLIARALIRAANRPIAAPSANRSNEISPTTAEHVFKGLNGRIDLILDGGPCSAGIESTVLDLSQSTPKLLRPGPIDKENLEKVIGPIELGMRHLGSDALPAPGMLAKHYSPITPTILCKQNGIKLDSRKRIVLALNAPEKLGSDQFILMPQDPDEYARVLYAQLHIADSMKVDQIVIVAPPQTSEWMAVNDRLSRAAYQE